MQQPAPGALPRLELSKPKAEGPAAGGRSVGGDGAPGAPGAAAPASGPARAEKEEPNKSTIKVEVQKTAPGNANKGRTMVGVGEPVTFSSTIDGAWSAGGKDVGSGSSTAWTAPDKPGSTEIAFTPKGGAAQKLTMKTVAPSGVDFASRGGFPVAPAGVGMTTNVTVLPNIVSFGACEWLETPGPADGVNGYFDAYMKAGKGDLAHNPNKTWLSMGDSNNAVEDHAWTSDNPKLLNPADNTMRHWQGAFGWNIPNKYRVNGDGDGVEFAHVRQEFTMADDGSVSVQKGAAMATQGGDGKVQGAMEKCTTVGQAHAMLNRQGSRTKMIMFVMQYVSSSDKDDETLRNLTAALRAEKINFYVHIYCDNTNNWLSRDGLSFSVKGPSGTYTESFNINTKKNKEITIPIEKLMDFGTMNPGAFIIRADNDDGKMAFSTVCGFPFDPINEADAGSGGHYKISAHVQ